MNFTSKPRYPALLLAIILLQACSPAPSEDASVTPAQEPEKSGLSPVQTYDAATSTYSALDGTGLEIDSFAGRRVFVNYWATWCAPCIRELPSIARAEAELADENTIFLLASDESLEKITDFIDERGFEGNFIKLNGYFGGHGIHAVPSSVLYDENGELIGRWDGAYEWDSEEMLTAIRQAR